jgi:hypothetical protein
MAINQKYSFKDFTGQDFSSVDASEFNNTEIKGSCFYQEGEPDTEIFPTGVTGVTFIRCNLDNVKIPVGNTVDKTCINRKIKAQNDLEDWFLNDSNQPTEPMRKADYLRLGISTDPADIPSTKITEPIVSKTEKEQEVIS